MLLQTMRWFKKALGPLLLMMCCPPLVLLVWYVNVALNGSVSELYRLMVQEGFFHTVYSIGKPFFLGSALAWKMLALFVGIELLFMRILPGKKIVGPVSPKGHIPLYKANGLASFICTMGLFLLASLQFHWFSAGIIYEHFGELLGALNLLSILLCVILYVKGRFFPSTSDCGGVGNVIFDYFWGTEMYPRIAGYDVKMFLNCRFGMMAWGLILASFAARQSQLVGLSDSLLVGVVLPLLYLVKFFIWEPDYLRSMDLMHDRAGFVICWGCMVWVPAIYTSPALFLVNHPYHLGVFLALLIFLAGSVCIFINYMADRQRHFVRGRNGECMVWKRKPELIFANYKTEWGEERQSLLLASGWWGISRHFHYIPEALAALFWSLPALFDYYLPYFYLTFLTCLLLHRVYRQEKHCSRKYGGDWAEYCRKVPFRLIPFVY